MVKELSVKRFIRVVIALLKIFTFGGRFIKNSLELLLFRQLSFIGILHSRNKSVTRILKEV